MGIGKHSPLYRGEKRESCLLSPLTHHLIINLLIFICFITPDSVNNGKVQNGQLTLQAIKYCSCLKAFVVKTVIVLQFVGIYSLKSAAAGEKSIVYFGSKLYITSRGKIRSIVFHEKVMFTV